jgi:hypothetical protein
MMKIKILISLKPVKYNVILFYIDVYVSRTGCVCLDISSLEINPGLKFQVFLVQTGYEYAADVLGRYTSKYNFRPQIKNSVRPFSSS